MIAMFTVSNRRIFAVTAASLLALLLQNPLLISALQPSTRFEAPEIDTRIVGGSAATTGEFPHQVYLEIQGVFSCGGSIISEKWVVTAGHCVADRATKFIAAAYQLTVTAGTSTRSPLPVSDTAIIRNVTQVIVHPTYLNGGEVDLALLQVDGTFAFNDYIKPIALAEAGADYTGRDAVTTGYGKLYFEGPDSYQLMKVTIPVNSNRDCEAITWNPEPKFDRRWDLCAGSVPEGDRGTCMGDSGGPLTVDGVLIGVTSRARGCAEPGIPTAFVRVAAPDVRVWILGVVNQPITVPTQPPRPTTVSSGSETSTSRRPGGLKGVVLAHFQNKFRNKA